MEKYLLWEILEDWKNKYYSSGQSMYWKENSILGFLGQTHEKKHLNIPGKVQQDLQAQWCVSAEL
jgi:hypothetical protein